MTTHETPESNVPPQAPGQPGLLPLDALWPLAFERYDALEANDLLDRARAAYETHHGQAVPYEVLVPDGALALDPSILGRLLVHLEAKRVSAESATVVFVAAFWGASLYLFEGPVFIEALLRANGLATGDVADRLRAYRARLAGPILALTAGDEPAGR